MDEQEFGMTKDEMQRLIDSEMRDGKTWEQALKKLAEIIGIHPSEA